MQRLLSSPISMWLMRVSLRFLILALLIVWGVHASLLVLIGDHSASHGFAARLYISARDAFMALPETIGWILANLGSVLDFGHAELTADLGYDPFGFQWSVGSGIEGLLGQLLFAVVVIASLQALGLFLMSALGMRPEFPSPSVAVFNTTFDQWIYLALIWGVAGGIAINAFSESTAGGVIGFVAAAITVKFRALSALPLYIFEGLKEKFGDPFVFLSKPGPQSGSKRHGDQSARRRKDYQRRGAGSDYRRHRKSYGGKAHKRYQSGSQKSSADREDHQSREDSSGRSSERDHHNSNDQSASSSELSFEDACSVLGVSPEDLTERTLTKAYRAKMKLHHPDREGGDAAEAKRVNQAYAFIKERKGW